MFFLFEGKLLALSLRLSYSAQGVTFLKLPCFQSEVNPSFSTVLSTREYFRGLLRCLQIRGFANVLISSLKSRLRYYFISRVKIIYSTQLKLSIQD